MEKEQILKERQIWYNFSPALYEIVKCLKNRELCFLSDKSEKNKKAVRYLLGFSVEYFKKHLNWINMEKSLLNIYHSVALLKPTVPIFSYNLSERKNDPKYIEFNENYDKYVQKYNFFIDIDGKENFDLALEETKQIKKIYDEYKVPYYILNSSLNGFHVVIPAYYMPDMDIFKLLENLNNILYNLIGIHSFKMVDLTIVDLKRVCKCPYSFVCDGSIVLPLNDEQLYNFNRELVLMNNVLLGIKIKNRGLLIREHNLTEKQLKENVLKFIEDYK